MVQETDPFLHLCLLCGSMCSLVGLCVPYIFVDPTKLHRGATPPSLMVLLFVKQSKEFTNEKIAEVYGIDINWRDFYNSPYKLASFCTEYFLLKEFDIALSNECHLFETTLKSGNYSDGDFDFMAEERRQNAQAIKEEFKAKYDPINKQAKEDYLSEQKEMQKIYRKKKCNKVTYSF